MAPTYRRHWGRADDWHFNPDCPDWPTANYTEQADPPRQEELCRLCAALQKKKDPDPGPRNT